MALKGDLLYDRRADAVAMVIIFHVERKQVESYSELHQGMHYRLPAVYVSVDEATKLRQYAAQGLATFISVGGEISPAIARNLMAILPEQTDERTIFETHTNGNTSFH
jgi:hypothetical protein